MTSRIESVRKYVDSIFGCIENAEDKRTAYIHSYGVSQCCGLLALNVGWTWKWQRS